MAGASKTMTLEVPIEKIWNVIVDFESDPKFMDMVSEAKITSTLEKGRRIDYSVELLGKQITYTSSLRRMMQKPCSRFLRISMYP